MLPEEMFAIVALIIPSKSMPKWLKKFSSSAEIIALTRRGGVSSSEIKFFFDTYFSN